MWKTLCVPLCGKPYSLCGKTFAIDNKNKILPLEIKLFLLKAIHRSFPTVNSNFQVSFVSTLAKTFNEHFFCLNSSLSTSPYANIQIWLNIKNISVR